MTTGYINESEDWNSNGNFEEFNTPQSLEAFLKRVLFGLKENTDPESKTQLVINLTV